MVYFYYFEYDVGGIDLIMNFLVTYLLIGNVIPVTLMNKIKKVYAKIESNHFG